MNYETFKLIWIAVVILSNLKILFIHLRLFSEYMFNVKSTWYDKKVEKPRVYFHLVALIPFLFSFLFLKSCEGELSEFKNTLYFIAFATFIIVATLIILFSWSKYFEIEGVNKIKRKLEEEIKEFKIKKDIDINEIIHNVIANKIVDERSRGDLVAFIKEKPIKNKIIWISKVHKSKKTSNVDLYSFLDIIYEDGIKNLRGVNRKKLANLIVSNFTKTKADFDEDNVYKNYTNWTSKNKKRISTATKN